MNIILSNSSLTATINSKGAELISLKNKNNHDYLWDGNPDFWDKHSPVLFPIVGSLKDDLFLNHNKIYHLTRHGFVRDLNFNLIDKSENWATFSLCSSQKTLEMYPFEFELQIMYFLEKSKLQIQYRVINKSSEKMPFSIGAHPAFALAGNFEDYELEFEKENELNSYLLADGLLSENTEIITLIDKKLSLNYSLFENDALILKNIKSKTITILKKSKPFLKIHFDDFPHLGIWTKVSAPFICIEPWFGYSDSPNSKGNLFEKEGIQVLGTNEIFQAKYTIEIV